jgi:hypothetical protein
MDKWTYREEICGEVAGQMRGQEMTWFFPEAVENCIGCQKNFGMIPRGNSLVVNDVEASSLTVNHVEMKCSSNSQGHWSRSLLLPITKNASGSSKTSATPR